MVYERFYNCHAEWIEIKPRGWVSLLKLDFERKGYLYYKPLNGLMYRSKIQEAKP